ncbi:DNA-3-methyladenine glycosylase I [Acetobacter sp.]|uniref:DNA-3-methyladenine glycosylase I n=1 Tax=Acetobacter sp. TaxID=440 RepID=UPI0039EC6B9D
MKTAKGQDGLHRCAWCLATPAYEAYHDTEWGFPISSDQHLFEKLCLEGFQAGLSWRTILQKREAFREAFAGFDPERVARFDEVDVQRLLADAGIVRHRGKIEAAINNAQRMLEIVEQEGSLATYVWRFEPERLTAPEVVTETAASRALSKNLKKRGWKFVGPTTMYAFMQAMGLVNDHAPGCVTREKVDAARAVFEVPV